MLIGMWVGPLISPPGTVQHNGVFDEIQCRKLTVVDAKGKTAVILTGDESVSNSVVVYNHQGEGASEEWGNATDRVFNKRWNDAVGLYSSEGGN